MPFLLEDLIFIKCKNSCIKVINRNVLMPKEGTLTTMKKVFLLLKRNFYCFLAVFQKQSMFFMFLVIFGLSTCVMSRIEVRENLWLG